MSAAILNPAPPQFWSFNPATDVLHWRDGNGEDAATLRSGAMMALIAAVFVLVCVFPVYLLTELLLAASAGLRGVPYVLFSHWSDPVLWLPLLGTAALAASMLFTLSLGATVVACEFDARNQTLRYTESRAGRRARSTVVPFDAILSVRPRLMSSHATAGDFEVTLRDPRGKVVSKSMGRGTELVVLRTHARWLKGMLAERVEPTLQLDT